MIESSFKAAMSQAGLHTKDKIIADGNLRRFQVEGDKPRSINGWYVLFSEGVPAGSFGSWKTGQKHTWHSRGFNTLTNAEKERFDAQMLKAKREREAEDRRIKVEAAKRANDIWNQAKLCPDTYPYLAKKNVKAYGIKLHGNKLIIPMRDIEGKLRSIQTIDEHGKKRFLAGGRKKGCFLTLGSPYSALNIAEGYATAATLYESTGVPTAVSFDAGNMIHVAKAWRSKHPALEITLCADNDIYNSINTGVTKAKEAALAIDGLIAIPPCHGDFNDYYNGIKK